MVDVRRGVKQKVVIAAAGAMLLVGVSIAAVSATGQNSPRNNAAAHHDLHRGAARDLAAAAGYLGISPAQLAGELSSAKTLAQVADASAGKSAAGLTQALVAARKARLASVAAKLASASSKLPQRVAAEVNRAGGPAGARHLITAAARLDALFSAPKASGAVAAGYLGVAPARLKAQLHAGETLAQAADATAGKSQAGLVQALIAPRRSRLAEATAAGRLSKARHSKRLAGLQKRMSALVQRQFTGAGSS
jgi:hypothetical protein